jgi:O-methyltransferase
MPGLGPRSPKRRWVERLAHAFYSRFVLPRVHDPLTRQRLKLSWFGWGYMPLLLRPSGLTMRERVTLLSQFVRIDWHILHSHTPYEVSAICIAASLNRGMDRGHFVEAGCWNGGSSAKFSFLCRTLGYELHVYDSFKGVEDVGNIAGEWDYAGEDVATETTVRENIARHGAGEVTRFHPGWFSATLAVMGAPTPVQVAYIDCDIAKGTREALSGIVPALAPKGIVFSQDYHIASVRRLLEDTEIWKSFHRSQPVIEQVDRRLAKLTWP